MEARARLSLPNDQRPGWFACNFSFGNRTIERAGMDLFLSSDVLSHIGEEKSEESDSEGETALGDFDSFLLGKDDVDFICDQGQVKI